MKRNLYLGQSYRGAATFQCVVPLEELFDEGKAQPILKILRNHCPPDKKLKGLVFKYTLCRSIPKINRIDYPNEKDYWERLAQLYQERVKTNLAFIQLNGTIGPWYEGDFAQVSTGHFLTPKDWLPRRPDDQKQPCLGTAIVNTKKISKGEKELITLDLSMALPDHFKGGNIREVGSLDQNPKLDIGKLFFWRQTREGKRIFFPVEYKDLQKGDAAGWIFDFVVKDPGPTMAGPNFGVSNATANCKDYLLEIQYYCFPNHRGVYAEQGLAPKSEEWCHMPSLPLTSGTFSAQKYEDVNDLCFHVFEWGELKENGDH